MMDLSAFFGKKNNAIAIETYVKKGDFESALKIAIETGDCLYDSGKKEEALSTYLKLLDLYNTNHLSNHKLYEKIYEKIIPLLFELGKEEEAVQFSLLLVDEKVLLKKNSEAKDIIDALISEYKNNEAVVLKDVEFNISSGSLEEALSVLKKAIDSIGAKPKFLEITGEILLKLHKYDEAYNYYNALLSIEADNELAKRRISEIQAANELSASSKKEESESVKAPETDKNKNILTGSVKNEKLYPKKVLKVNRSENKSSSEKSVKNEKFANTKEVLKVNKLKDKSGVKESVENKKVLGREEAKVKLPESGESNDTVQITLFKDPAYMNAIKEVLKDKKKSFEKLLSLAKRYESSDYAQAEYIYYKLLLLSPGRKDIYDRLFELYKSKNLESEGIFVLRIAADNCSGSDKLPLLRKLEELVKGDSNISKEIFDVAFENKDKETAVEYFIKLKDNEDLFDRLSDNLFVLVKDDLRLLETVAQTIHKKNRKNEIAFRYYYTLGKIYFKTNGKPEGLKWLMRAHSIKSLPLEDCIEVAEYIKDLPLDNERDAIAKTLNGYVNTINDKEKEENVYKLILNLKPGNVLYIKEYADFLDNEGKLKKMSELVKKLASKMDVNAADFIQEKIGKIAEYFSDEELIKVGEFLEAAGNANGVSKVYELLLKRDPSNKIAALKLLYINADMENMKFIINFFKEYTPSHKDAPIVRPVIEKLENKRSASPLDYHLHFTLGFMYFFIERYEEAIASFQFVARSHCFEPLMYLFIGISFEKIGLPDFALKQYEMVVQSPDALPELKESAYYNMAVLKEKNGDMEEAVKFAKEVLKINPENAFAKKIIDLLPDDGKKITKLEGK
jgi:tetratricopeptide (TPR) repeat protein